MAHAQVTPEMKAMIRQTVVTSPHFDHDSCYFCEELNKAFDWFKDLDVPRQAALIALCLIIGLKNVIALSNLLFFLSKSNFLAAAEELIKSGYEHIAHIISTGEIKGHG